MKKAIIYAGEFVLPDKSASANRVVSNAEIFKELGFRTYFFGSADSSEAFDGIRQIKGHPEMFERAHPSSTVQWAKHIFSTADIRQLAEKYDAGIIILYNLPVITLLRVKRAFRNTDIKIVYDCTEWTAYTDGGMLKRLFKATDEWFVRNTLDIFADNIIVISEMMRKKYKKCRNIIKLPPLVDVSDPIWHQKPTDKMQVFEFCFAGVPDGKKESPDKIVGAFSKIKNSNIRLKIAGMTKEDFVDAYPDYRDTAADERISFMGKVSHTKAVKQMTDCDCYIFIRPSDRRNNAGFPTKFAEAYTLSCTMIASEVSDIGAYFNNESNSILLKDESEEKIKEAMEKVIAYGKAHKPRELNNTFDYHGFTDVCRDFFYK